MHDDWTYHLLFTQYHDWQNGPGHSASTTIDRVNCPECLAGFAAANAGKVTRDYPITLPTCEPYREGESIVDHGARVLAFILQTSCTATLSDQELERAHVASQYAICARGISIPAANNLSDVRHLIAFVLAERQQEQAEQAQLQTLGGQLKGKLGTGGPGDREPLQPKPKINPPAGVAIDPYAGRELVRDRVQF